MDPAAPAQHDVSKPRKVTSAQELRALAHPLRLRLLEELVVSDPATDTATASELAERVGESPANCSWHLRQLAKFGYIEEAPGGTGRERRWRAVIEMHDWDTANSRDPEFLAAADVAQDIVIDHEFQQLRQRRAWLANEPEEWRARRRIAERDRLVHGRRASRDQQQDLRDPCAELSTPDRSGRHARTALDSCGS